MRRIHVILLLACSLLTSVCYAQITISEKGVTFSRLFKQIRKQTGYRFVYNDNMLPSNQHFNVNVKDATINTLLDKYLRPVMLTYEIRPDKTVIIQQLKETQTTPLAALTPALRGKVTDENGQPLAGTNIIIKGTHQGATADSSGHFTLTIPDANCTIVVSFVGYVPQELLPWKSYKNIRLTTTIQTIRDVTIKTGMFLRNKNIFSGATATYSGKELRQVGTLNILESLKTLDPSLQLIPNNILGSNPNQIPKVEVRGKTGLSSNTVRDQFSNDPNQPLFILNGMETTLQQIIDLDMNRVASVTLLKDASSTALYGSRAANGVVVVETVKPQPGELRVSYSAILRLETPMLGDYNMMTAAELLEFQRQAGMYNPTFYNGNVNNDNLYNQRLAEVTRGVNSYWLSTPLRNSFTGAHSINVSGGNNAWQYNVGLNYRGLNGVMKGSDRKTGGAMIDLYYQEGKVKASNSLYINGTKAQASPYGVFSDYVNLSPYYRKKNADGSLNTDRYLDIFQVMVDNSSSFADTFHITNPLYNTKLGGENLTKNLLIQDQLNLIYDITPVWRLSGGFQITKNNGRATLFLPTDDTHFEGMDANQKGQYVETRTDAFSYQGNAMLTYRKVLNEIHSINGNLRSEIQEQGQTVTGFSAVGFPSGVRPGPNTPGVYAHMPVFQKTKARRVNALASVNYAYKSRYYIDATYRLDGSTAFGSEKKYSPFWSLGAGWNISNEARVAHLTWLNNLRIRANIGTTGNQSLGTYVSTSVYGFENNTNVFGPGIYMRQLGNPLLQWQRTRTANIGLDAGLWHNRLMATIDVYDKYSNPLVVVGTKPASIGVTTYAFNVGSLRSKGIEANIHFSPFYLPEKNIQWTIGIMGAFYKSRYRGFSNLLKNLNDSALQENSLLRYMDNNSPDELWAVRSLGIDPSSGKELFLKKDGTQTFTYDPADIVAIGDGRPMVQGVVSSNLTYKGFRLGLYLRYSIRQLIMNEALYSKVENISFNDLVNNQDKRALTQRWKQSGDQAEFKGISITDNTPMSSRFMQRESYISGESISAGYEMYANKHPWMQRTPLHGIRFEAIMNDIFRLSTIKSERGIDYPFSRAISFNLYAYF